MDIDRIPVRHRLPPSHPGRAARRRHPAGGDRADLARQDRRRTHPHPGRSRSGPRRDRDRAQAGPHRDPGAGRQRDHARRRRSAREHPRLRLYQRRADRRRPRLPPAHGAAHALDRRHRRHRQGRDGGRAGARLSGRAEDVVVERAPDGGGGRLGRGRARRRDHRDQPDVRAGRAEAAGDGRTQVSAPAGRGRPPPAPTAPPAAQPAPQPAPSAPGAGTKSRPRSRSRRRSPPPATYRVLANVSGGVQNLRSGPAVKYPIVIPIPAGATGIVLGACRAAEDNTRPWCQATWRGLSGWISSCCIVDEKTGAPPKVN